MEFGRSIFERLKVFRGSNSRSQLRFLRCALSQQRDQIPTFSRRTTNLLLAASNLYYHYFPLGKGYCVWGFDFVGL